jgi:hypothetical protein
MKFKVLLALLCISLCASAAALSPALQKSHKASHKIKMSTILGEGPGAGSCSAVAVGPHALLTAGHCGTISAVITVDDKDADVLGTLGDGLDHLIILLGGVSFTDYADVASVNLQQGDEVYVFGNPGPFTDVFRKGYVSTLRQKENDPDRPVDVLLKFKTHEGNEDVQITYYDLNGFFGDSGSALFNAEGQVVAITSFISGGMSESGFGLKFMGSYEIRLSKEMLKMARDFNPPEKPKAETPKKKKSIFDIFGVQQP